MTRKHIMAGIVIAFFAALTGCEPGSYDADVDAPAQDAPASASPATESNPDAAAATTDEEDASPQGSQLSDIVDTAVAAGSFETLAAALAAADLVETLKTEGPFTVFAPTDAAFEKLPEGTVENLLKPENKDQLVAVLTYHVVAGKVDSSAVSSLPAAETLNGADLVFDTSSESVRVNDATVTTADIACSNGIIHVVDTVILPPQPAGAEEKHDEPLTIEGIGSFETLFAAIEAAGLSETLKEDGPFTVFAPTDEAFAALPEGTVENLLQPENKDQLVAILTYHVVAGEVPSSQVVELQSAKTVHGGELAIEVADGVVRVGGAQVLKTDVPCDVGLIHAIDKVLLP